MGKLYFFVSSKDDDNVTRFNVFTSSVLKAYKYAFKYFREHDCEGMPRLLAI